MSLFDLSGAVALLSSHTVTVTRFATDTYDSTGKSLARTSTTFTARVSLQPVSGREVKRLPEGVRGSELVSVHASTELKIRDRITVTGRGDFEVQHVDHWGDSGNHWKAIAKQLNSGEPR